MTDTVAGKCPLCPPETPTQSIGRGPDFEYATVPEEFQVVGCERCGTWFLDPRPADEVIPALYPPEYEPYHFAELPSLVRKARGVVQRRKAAEIRRWADEDARILDLGCGGGNLLRLLKEHGSGRWTLIGWDFPGPHLDELANEGFEVISAPVSPEHVPSRPVDLVILNQVIEHFADPAEIIDVVDLCLRPGGVVLIETPDVDGLDARFFRRRYWGGFHFPRHLVLFNARSLTTLLESHGYEVVQVEHLVSAAFWNQSMHHWLSERRLGKRVAGFFSIRNPLTLGAATVLDLVIGKIRPTSNVRVVGRRPDSIRSDGHDIAADRVTVANSTSAHATDTEAARET